MNKTRMISLSIMLIFAPCSLASAKYPVVRPERTTPAPDSGNYSIFPNDHKQVVWGMGFEIQCDSFGSKGGPRLPEATTSVPHDLTVSERKRLAGEMLSGFRYCRLAGGLYWRGTDPTGKYLQPRWPQQLTELKELLDRAGVEGLSFEYWSPAPFWKANGKYIGRDDTENILRCFGKDFANDPVYHGDVNAFLKDFAKACVQDVETLEKAGLKISMWGLGNEPWVDQTYSSCKYTEQGYGMAFKAVAPAIRKHNPDIKIIADTMDGWPQFIGPVMKVPEYAKYVDALVVHGIGHDSNWVINNVTLTRQNIKQKLPLFQNEYEYSQASRDRCHNTVQNIMNWYQLAESPTWFWLHVLKPLRNAEASGFSLGFWMPVDPDYNTTHNINPDTIETKKQADTLKLAPGHWTWNNYNWYSLVGFLKHMPWDSRVVDVKEETFDDDMRILAYKKPEGKLVFVLSNRSFKNYTFNINTGLDNKVFKGYRYTPDNAGDGFMGVGIGTIKGGTVKVKVPDLAWEFWVQQ